MSTGEVKPKRIKRRPLTVFQKVRRRFHCLTVESVAESFRKCKGNMSAVARAHGVTRNAVEYFFNAHLDILGPIREEASQTVIDHIEYNLFDTAEQGEQWAVAMVLAAKARDRGYTRQPMLAGGVGPDAMPLIQIYLPDNFRGPVRAIQPLEVLSNGQADQTPADDDTTGSGDRVGTDLPPSEGEASETSPE